MSGGCTSLLLVPVAVADVLRVLRVTKNPDFSGVPGELNCLLTAVEVLWRMPYLHFRVVFIQVNTIPMVLSLTLVLNKIALLGFIFMPLFKELRIHWGLPQEIHLDVSVVCPA